MRVRSVGVYKLVCEYVRVNSVWFNHTFFSGIKLTLGGDDAVWQDPRSVRRENACVYESLHSPGVYREVIFHVADLRHVMTSWPAETQSN